MKNNKYYAILKEATDNTLFLLRDIPNKGNWVNKNDKYILFEVEMDLETGQEKYTNAWGSTDKDYIVTKAKRFDSWYNYLDGIGQSFSGVLTKLY
jgi:hypothetical protein